MRTIGVVTVARSDHSIYLPVWRAIEAHPELELQIVVSGMHLAPEFGMTVDAIEQAGFTVHERLEMLVASDSPEGVGKSVGLGVISFAQLFSRWRPDILLVLGDRFEMLTPVLAALPFGIPIAHLHGGESTQGAIDESIRHAMTKCSHLHFVSTQDYKRRVIQLGELPERVTVCGAPALDNVHALTWLDREALEQRVGMALEPAPLLVTFHPVTLEYQDTEAHIQSLLQALDEVALPVIFTYPNADTMGHSIIRAIQAYVDKHDNARFVTSLGTLNYYSILHHVSAMVGNSSSGIIEAASFQLPVVNIGNRQKGRISGKNVLHVAPAKDEIVEAIRRAATPAFKEELADFENPYGDGHASTKIVEILASASLSPALLTKPFYDLPDPKMA